MARRTQIRLIGNHKEPRYGSDAIVNAFTIFSRIEERIPQISIAQSIIMPAEDTPDRLRLLMRHTTGFWQTHRFLLIVETDPHGMYLDFARKVLIMRKHLVLAADPNFAARLSAGITNVPMTDIAQQIYEAMKILDA